MGNNVFFRAKSKFKNRFVRIDGHLFHSQKEAKWWLFLEKREQNNEISRLQRQVRYEIYRTKEGKPRYYIADFVFTDELGEHVVDVKSHFTAKDPVFRIKRELFEATYKRNLEIWTGNPPKNYLETLDIGRSECPKPLPKTKKGSSKKLKKKALDDTEE